MIKYYCIGPVSDFLQENYSLNGRDHFFVEEFYRSGAIKINNFQGTNPQVVNGQRLKHYLSRNPYNVEADIIQVVTPENHIRAKYTSRPESEL